MHRSLRSLGQRPALPLCFLLGAALTLAPALGFAAEPRGGAPLSVFVVRHADKPDDEPATDALSSLGAARAQALAERLVGAGISELVASEKRRTQLTAQPLWEASVALGRQARRCIARDARAIVRAVERSRASAILVVTHGDQIDDVIAALTGHARVPEPCACEYDRLYRVEFPSGYQAGRGLLQLETFGALPLGPAGEPCSAALPIDPLTCKGHPRSPRAALGQVAAGWRACTP